MLHKSKPKRTLATAPTRIITVSFALVILGGTLLLTLPVSSRAHIFTPFLDCLFTATSATCVTGLIRFDTYTHWSTFGQMVILTLIQIGGLGLVTFTTFFNIMIGRKLGLRGRDLAQQSVNSLTVDIRRMIKMVIGTSLLLELAGALILMTRFVPMFGSWGVFLSMFIAISAFCNAGFDLMGRVAPLSSLCDFNGEPVILITVGLLIILGGISFIVIYDLVNYRQTRQLTLHTRVVVSVTLILILMGTFFTAVLEWNNPITLASLPSDGQRWLASWFHSVSCRTAGFNSIDVAGLHDSTKIVSSVLMFIGAAPGSTAGGLKCTTVAVIFMTVVCVVRGQEDTIIMRRKVDKGAVYKSLAVMVLGFSAVIATAACIVLTMRASHAVTGVDAVFESVSAFATVGLSVGIADKATVLPSLLLIFSMYIGRLGPVTFFLSMALRAQNNRKEILPEGKIQIG